MSSPQSNRHGSQPVEDPFNSSPSSSSTQAPLDGLGPFLETPQKSQGAVPRGSHAHSRSAGDLGNTTTTFHFGRKQSSEFVLSASGGPSAASALQFHSNASSQMQDPDYSSFLSTYSHGARQPDMFRFGSGDNEVPEPEFSFESLHNFTPVPSRQPSPILRTPDASLSALSPSPGSSPMPAVSVSGGYLSPPKFSLTQGSSTSTPDITTRIRSLSLQAAPTSSLASRAGSQTPADAASTGRSEDIGRDDSPRPYDPREETGPAHEYFTTKFQKKLQEGGNIAKEAVTAIEELGDAMELDEEVELLLRKAKEMSPFRSDVTRKIAILGDSGEGKSSLINSLLHFPGLAQTGDIGSACTSVVTEYRHKQLRHTAPITIEVEYLSSARVEDLLHELLWSYRQLYLPIVESNETSDKDYARYQAESEQAWSALHAAFGHQPNFRKEFLRDMSDGASERAFDQLVRWSREIEWPNGAEGGSWTSTATTAEECCEKTTVFMQDRLWPFTKIIRVYLSSQILKTGIILADLPGLQDTNLARVRATQDYLMQCDHVLIVAKIARAITNKSVKSSMYWALSRHIPLEWEQSAGKHLNFSLVCTRSEDINIKAAKSEFCGPGKRIPSEVINQLEADIENAKNSQDRQRKKELKRRLEFLLIRARNAHVKHGVQQAYSSEISEGKLEIFCVSNTVYEKYCRKGIREFVEESGVLELRRFCHAITAEAQMREARHYLGSSLASLLNSLGLWAGSQIPLLIEPVAIFTGSMRKSLEDAKLKARQSVFQLRQDFMQCFDEQITATLTAREPHWDKSARVEARSWEVDWHWTQYNAWCLHNGNYYTEKRGAVDWNAKMIWKMRLELAYQWDLAIDEVAVVFQALRESVVASLKDLQELIQVSPKTDALTALAKGIDPIVESWKHKLRLTEESFADGLIALKRRSSESHPNSYIFNEMISSYRSASNERGTGKAARQRGIVGGKVFGGTIFPNLAIRLSAETRTLAEETGQALNELVTEIMGRLEDDMRMALRVSNCKNNITKNNKAHAESIRALRRQIDVLKAKQNALGID